MVDHLFVDSGFLVARYNRQDRNFRAVRTFLDPRTNPDISGYRFVLSDYVFDEAITTLLYRGGRHERAVEAGNAIRNARALQMVPVERPVFEAAWSLFVDRPDKLWSFTDCTSFVLMDNLAIRTALTFDKNFREAGFATLP